MEKPRVKVTSPKRAKKIRSQTLKSMTRWSGSISSRMRCSNLDASWRISTPMAVCTQNFTRSSKCSAASLQTIWTTTNPSTGHRQVEVQFLESLSTKTRCWRSSPSHNSSSTSEWRSTTKTSSRPQLSASLTLPRCSSTSTMDFRLTRF